MGHRMAVTIGYLALCLTPVSWPTDAAMAQMTEIQPVAGPSQRDSAMVNQLYEADQADRGIGTAPGAPVTIDWLAVFRRDQARREQLRRVISENGLSTAADFARSALVLLHGSSSDDYLLAHILATAAVARGSQSSIWLAAATLDRYLWSIRRSQVYGTQFQPDTASGGKWTQAPYDRSLLTDQIRAAEHVAPLAAQSNLVDQMNGPK